jgi:hypothetical protein
MDTDNHLRWLSFISGSIRLCEFQGRRIKMDLDLILSGKATLEDLYQLYGLGYLFIIEDGSVKYHLYPRQL